MTIRHWQTLQTTVSIYIYFSAWLYRLNCDEKITKNVLRTCTWPPKLLHILNPILKNQCFQSNHASSVQKTTICFLPLVMRQCWFVWILWLLSAVRKWYSVRYTEVCYSKSISSLTLWITVASAVSRDPFCLKQLHSDWCWQKKIFCKECLTGGVRSGQMIRLIVMWMKNCLFFCNVINISTYLRSKLAIEECKCIN